MTKVVTWNLKNGGTAKTREHLLRLLDDPEVALMVLTEYRDNQLRLVQTLADRGWKYLSTQPGDNNGILVTARTRVEPTKAHESAPDIPHRWLEADLPDWNVNVTAVHAPGGTEERNKRDQNVPLPERWGKERFWQRALPILAERVTQRHLLIGDFNAGFYDEDCDPLTSDPRKSKPFHKSSPEYLAALHAQGWKDAYREAHGQGWSMDVPTWEGKQRGTTTLTRIDRVYMSPSLFESFRGAQHIHSVRPGISDHSLVVMQLDA